LRRSGLNGYIPLNTGSLSRSDFKRSLYKTGN
jgi:hypothetical protein